jgi:hypothetical protein
MGTVTNRTEVKNKGKANFLGLKEFNFFYTSLELLASILKMIFCEVYIIWGGGVIAQLIL